MNSKELNRFSELQNLNCYVFPYILQAGPETVSIVVLSFPFIFSIFLQYLAILLFPTGFMYLHLTLLKKEVASDPLRPFYQQDD